MSRPVSGRPASGLHGGRRPPSRSRTYSGSGCQELLSYEDIIIAQYLEELRKPPPHTKNGYTHTRVLYYSIIVSGVMAGGSGNCPPPPQKKLAWFAFCRNILFKKYKIWCWKLPILRQFRGKIEILSTCKSSVRNLQLYVRKLQLSASSPTFLTHNATDYCNYRSL